MISFTYKQYGVFLVVAMILGYFLTYAGYKMAEDNNVNYQAQYQQTTVQQTQPTSQAQQSMKQVAPTTVNPKKAEKRKALKKEYIDFANNAYRNNFRYRTPGELAKYMRGVCLTAITHTDVCYTLPIKFENLPENTYAVTNFHLDDNGNGNYAQSITVNRMLYGKPVRELRFAFAHEWNHVETAYVTKTKQGYDAMERRAQLTYGNINGKSLSAADASEIQTDCMTLYRSNLLPHGVPAYLANSSLLGYKDVDYYKTCGEWYKVLYDDPYYNKFDNN